MAEAIISEVVSTIIEKLGSGAYKKLVYAKDLDSHITTLQELKTTIEATLVDAETLETCSNSQQDVLNKLRTTLSELDDFLEERADKTELKQVMRGNKLIKPVRVFFSESNQLFSPLRDATKLKTILKKFDRIASYHAKYGSIVISSPTVNQNRGRNFQMASSSILNNLFVGRDRERDNIVSMLSEDSMMTTDTLTVESIYGMDGMGKTALAQHVYDDYRVKRCFDAWFWVSVPRNFDVVEMLMEMITCRMEKTTLPHNCNAVLLRDHVIQAISGKKFLLVLDNIGFLDHATLRLKWADLKSLLQYGAKGSKVLITTPDKKVAEIMDSVNSYKLEGLTEEDSWLLFQKIAFTQYQEPGVEVIGMEISKMCPNMPLVIQNVAGILARKRTVREWQAFRDEQFADFASYGSDVERTLKLSYDQLDESLKRCVKFCTLFEKGGFFHLEQMIHRWIALGYVKPQYKSQRLEEAGEEYMLSLQDFGFLEIDSFDQFGFIRDFKMHDVMYELVLSLAGVKYKAADSNTDKILLGRAFLISVFESAALYFYRMKSCI
ncbi:disease resistance protein RGA2-like [Spinacia oleracea]|uniref:Disease resistance protein RGA2-like n=1 Tax=Spinacia oleracea TaxID=3562 RepID=A0A9R0I5L3_SPIOL|nr:disease resistance protein RGA2-like [Spinacia oleracea]